MKVICENCGMELEGKESEIFVKCPACGYITQTGLPKANEEERYARADFYLKEEEFDLAYREYGRILDLNSNDAKAHWGQFLCRYGIEYVKDPATEKEMPTLHRNLPQSVLDCPSYLLAVENANEKEAAYYRSQAEEIRKIQLYIEDAAKKMDPFDIFISYKEEDGKIRTEDSYRAQDIYRSLTDMGYHVFYARETLLKKTGEEYEPIIYSALSTAKMMLVLGTKKEYFKAVWVQNEWGRYLELKKQDRSRILVPVYRDIEDLPDELSVILESQNIDAPDFQSELLKYVKATIRPNLGKSLTGRKESQEEQEARRRKTVITEAYYRLEEGKFDEAKENLNSLLAERILNYQIALGMLYATRKVRNREELIARASREGGDIQKAEWYQKAWKAANDREKEELEGLIAGIQEKRKRNEYQSLRKEKYQTDYKKLSEELSYLRNPDGAETFSVEKEGQRLLDKRKALLDKRRALTEKENLPKPAWWVVIANLILMFVPANVILIYFFSVPGLNISISESYLLIAAAFFIANGALMVFRKGTVTLALCVLWAGLLAAAIQKPELSYLLYLLEAVIIFALLTTVIKNKRLGKAIKQANEERKQYETELEELGTYIKESILPSYKEKIRQLSKIAAEGGIRSEERLENEMKLREKIESLDHQITMNLTL